MSISATFCIMYPGLKKRIGGENMFCPKCRSEFREGFNRCESCDVDLVEEKDLPGEQPMENFANPFSEKAVSENEKSWTREDDCPPDAVKIFESLDPFLVTTVGNLLFENEIPFYVLNRELGNTLPSAIFGVGSHESVNPAQFLVLPDREAEARALLDDFLKIPADGKQVFSDLPPELAQATDEPDPDSEVEPACDKADDADESDEEKTIYCPYCRAELDPTADDHLAGKTACHACGKTIELD